MADTKISALTAIDAVASGDEFPANDVSATTTKKVTAAQLATYVNTTTGSAVTAMTAASASDGTELHYVVQGGADRKMTGAQIATYARSYTFPLPVATRWYDPHRGLHGGAGAVWTANRIYFTLLEVQYPMTVSDLGCRVSSAAAAGKLLQLAIYALNATTGYPTGAALASTGSIAADSAAAVSADITGSNVLLPAGFYWGAVNSDGSPAIRGPSASPLAEALIGTTTLANITGSMVGVPLKFYFDQTYGTWPNMTSNSCTEELNTTGGSVFLKAA